MDSIASSARALGVARVSIGLIQGLALYLIYLAYDERTWPATDGLIFAPLMLVALFVPLLALQASGNIRWRTLAIWCGAAAAIVAGLGFYDIWHAWPEPPSSGASRLGVTPSTQLFFALVAGLFIAQSLIEAGDADRRFIASYTTYFDVAWKLAVQGALAVAFTGAFWGLLWLGAGLFNLLKLDFMMRLIQHEWFAIPGTTLVFSAAIHLTDVRAGIVRGVRTLGLSLLSWLLPLMTLIAAGFLATLPFSGVQPLWDTQFATRLLLIAFSALIILVNAAYQDGDAERQTPRVLRYPGSIAALALVPLAALAAYALYLRIDQYGWTAQRIYVCACAFVAGFYALGYAAAVFGTGPWLKRVERWNFYGALVVLAVLLALFSPVADPYRISVANQVTRLESGRVSPEQFDFTNLRWQGGRFGYAALERLRDSASGERAAYVRDTAQRAILATNRYARLADPEITTANVAVHPADAKLPATFVAQDWSRTLFTDGVVPFQPGCLRGQRSAMCDAWMKDLDGDGKDEIIVLERNAAFAYRLNSDGRWQTVGSWLLPNSCPKILTDMQAGNFTTAPPKPGPWPDLEISGQKFRFSEVNTVPACPN